MLIYLTEYSTTVCLGLFYNICSPPNDYSHIRQVGCTCWLRLLQMGTIHRVYEGPRHPKGYRGS
jgi:hypothetical protein